MTELEQLIEQVAELSAEVDNLYTLCFITFIVLYVTLLVAVIFK